LCLSLLLNPACGSSDRTEWKEGSVASSDQNGSLFDVGDLDNHPGLDAGAREWYSKHLSAAGETSLRVSSADEAYRFTHLPSFAHPVVVRVEDRKHRRLIIAKELDGAGGYEPGGLLVERYRELTSDEWEEIQKELAGIRFWTLPKHACEDRDHPEDGMVWILEAKTRGEYSAVQWHWDDCSVCQYLADLADIQLDGVTPSRTQSPAAVPPPPEFDR
jgi:hypothetical protein